MRTSLGVPVVLCLIGAPVLADDDDCAHVARRDAEVDARGAGRLRVEAGAGSLRIEGRAGLGQVRVRGRACASRESLLEDIGLEAVREGDTVRVESRMPEGDWMSGWWNHQARLDLVIEVPADLEVDAKDGSGSTEVHGVKSLSLVDGSGSVRVQDVAGSVRIEDGSGSLEVTGVDGEVRIRDGSGSIRVRQVGSLVVESDGSGSIEVQDVRGDVRVDRDGSGSISVEGVGGDFVVGRDGSGGIDHTDVRGQVRLPGR